MKELLIDKNWLLVISFLVIAVVFAKSWDSEHTKRIELKAEIANPIRDTGQQLMLLDSQGKTHLVGEWNGSQWIWIPDPDPRWSAGIDNFHDAFLEFYGADSLVYSILRIDGKRISNNKLYVGY